MYIHAFLIAKYVYFSQAQEPLDILLDLDALEVTEEVSLQVNYTQM